MLTQIELERFKCFDILQLPLKPLTLLSGSNASGKTSVIHAIALLHQTIREQEWSSRLMLNGGIVRLGTVTDVVNQIYGRDELKIALADDEIEYSWTFRGERYDMSMEVHHFRMSGSGFERPSELHYLLPLSEQNEIFTNRLRDLTYLTAERIGPRDFYQLNDPQITPVVGPSGEHAASVLFSGKDESVLSELRVDGVVPKRLRQIEARLNAFFPGCQFEVERVPDNSILTLGIRTSPDTDYHRPIHTGFGITQVLPILISVLSAKKEDIVVVENPEIHLHPSGQAAIGRFLATAAAAGVQIILETHSDHVLNGIRRSVKGDAISAEEVALHFFRPRHESEANSIAQVHSPLIDDQGNLDDWPEGFFDQFDKDLGYFAGWE